MSDDKYTIADLLRDHGDRDMPVTIEDQNGCPFPIADVYVHPRERRLVVVVDHEDED
jgi:hypothetical protein